MEITNFITENFLSSFMGTLAAVELIVFTTKNFPLINKIPTKLYTFILAVIHLVIVQIIVGKTAITVEYVYISFLNSLIVELILCGGYDTLMSKFKDVKQTLDEAEEGIAEINGEVSKEVTNNDDSSKAIETLKSSKDNIGK